MKKALTPVTLGIIGLVLFGQGFIFQGILPDMLKIFGIILVIVSAIGMFRKKPQSQ